MTGLLVVIGGLPGTGKTTVARLVAARLGATHLRVDTIEQALRDSGELPVPVTAGYAVVCAVAADQLRAGRPAVADLVNPFPVTRAALAAVAAAARSRLLTVELVCSDPVVHRRRVEERDADIEGFRLPTWPEVVEREYVPWDDADLRVDTAAAGPVDVGRAVLATLAGRGWITA